MARPPSRRRRGTGVPSRLDIGIAVAAAALVGLGTIVAAGLQDQIRPLDAGAITLVALAASVIAWRRRAPVAVLGVIVTAMLSRALMQADLPALLLAVWASWLIIPWSVGALVQVRSAATRRARRELAARAALEERMRVATEVHDVAGHGFAAVAMQAGVALLVFEEQPNQAKESLEAIRSTSVKALADLRMMLDAFHPRTGAETGGAGAVASEGLRDLDALVDNVRAAGLPVRLWREEVAVPEGIGHVAYRVVQEALTNTLRHAGPTAAEVRVHCDQGTLLVDVLDGGVGAKDARPGRGLTGMRNRVAAAGGELIAQPRTDGGFRVCARLPIAGDAK